MECNKVARLPPGSGQRAVGWKDVLSVCIHANIFTEKLEGIKGTSMEETEWCLNRRDLFISVQLRDNSEGCNVSYYYWARNCCFCKG